MNALIEQMNTIAMGVDLVFWCMGAALAVVTLRVILDTIRGE
jgi:hypothetical protein